MTVMHTMDVMNTVTGSFGIHAMHTKKTEIPKGSSRGRCRPSMAGSESLFGSDNLPNIARVEPTAAFAEARLSVSRGQIRHPADFIGACR